jgi:hypothetical protein
MKHLHIKKTLITIAACAVAFSAMDVSAQEHNRDSNSTVILDGSLYDIVFSWNKKPWQKKRTPDAIEAHWAGFSFAFSDLEGLPKDVNLHRERSYSISLNIDDYELPIHPHWALVTGFGFDWTRFHFDGDVGLRNNNGYTDFFYDERTLTDSKLLVYYAKFPLLLEYQVSAKHKAFYIHGGVEGLLKLYSKSRIEMHNSREDFRNLNIYPVNMRLFLGIGYFGVGLFGYYQPFSMFSHRNGPELRSFGIGLSLN